LGARRRQQVVGEIAGRRGRSRQGLVFARGGPRQQQREQIAGGDRANAGKDVAHLRILLGGVRCGGGRLSRG
jgi:hypothetical protein